MMYVSKVLLELFGRGSKCRAFYRMSCCLLRPPHLSFFFFINLFIVIYLFLAVLGLRSCTRAFSSCGEQGLLFVAVRGLLIAVASLVVEHGL